MKKVLFFALTLLFLVYIAQSVREMYSLWKKQDVLTQARQKLFMQEKEQKKLLQQLSNAQQSGFVEEQARDKLFLIKPGEYRVSLQPESKTTVLSANEKPIPVWQQWMQRFFY